jgi:hypothetical protein
MLWLEEILNLLDEISTPARWIHHFWPFFHWHAHQIRVSIPLVVVKFGAKWSFGEPLGGFPKQVYSLFLPEAGFSGPIGLENQPG